MSVAVIQLHKRASYKFEHIQDKYAVNEANKCFTLADGTTQSFNSEAWAEIITKQFATTPIFEPEKLIVDFTNCVQLYKDSKFRFSANPATASLEKKKQQQGGTATFIGLQFSQNNHFNVINCGDANLFIIRNYDVTYFPYSDIEHLDENKFFLNTEYLLQNKVEPHFFQTKQFSSQPNDILVMATDALSRLLLKQPEAIKDLITIDDFEVLREFCLKQWENKTMEEDDISAIIIRIDGTNAIKRIIPPESFSFPVEKIPEFSPTPLTSQKSLNQFSDMQMKEINRMFDCVADDFHQVKRKLRFHQLLLMLAISLMVINLLTMCLLAGFFYLKANKNKASERQKNQVEKVEKKQ